MFILCLKKIPASYVSSFSWAWTLDLGIMRQEYYHYAPATDHVYIFFLISFVGIYIIVNPEDIYGFRCS